MPCDWFQTGTYSVNSRLLGSESTGEYFLQPVRSLPPRRDEITINNKDLTAPIQQSEASKYQPGE